MHSLDHWAEWLPLLWPDNKGQTEAVRVLSPAGNSSQPVLAQSPPGQSQHGGSDCSMTPGGHQTGNGIEQFMALGSS